MVIIMGHRMGISELSMMIIILYVFGRFLTINACRSVCNGKWKKIKENVRPSNIWEAVTLSYFLKQKTKHPYIMEYMIITINAEIINSLLCVLFFIWGHNRYILTWVTVWLVHLIVLTFLFRKYVR